MTDKLSAAVAALRTRQLDPARRHRGVADHRLEVLAVAGSAHAHAQVAGRFTSGHPVIRQVVRCRTRACPQVVGPSQLWVRSLTEAEPTSTRCLGGESVSRGARRQPGWRRPRVVTRALSPGRERPADRRKSTSMRSLPPAPTPTAPTKARNGVNQACHSLDSVSCPDRAILPAAHCRGRRLL